MRLLQGNLFKFQTKRIFFSYSISAWPHIVQPQLVGVINFVISEIFKLCKTCLIFLEKNYTRITEHITWLNFHTINTYFTSLATVNVFVSNFTFHKIPPNHFNKSIHKAKIDSQGTVIRLRSCQGRGHLSLENASLTTC